ncbi:unannotated protein [freshwater metagenome]|uniref:Unannotated protein n=1 Tax=freshwater metagenome TaxID=449393 RepID=A0A6J7SCY5_9ZZZZ
MMVITNKMIGIIVRLSRVFAVRTSKYTALVPPTSDVGSAACANSRIFGISFPASTLSGALSNVRFKTILLFTIFAFGSGCPGTGIPSNIGAICETPGAFFNAAVTASALSALTTTCVGLPSPPGKWVSKSFCPTTDSGLPVKVSTVPIPSAFKVVDANANNKRIDPEIAQAFRGFFPIVFPTFAQGPDIT